MAATGLRKGGWTEEEDILLRNCIHKYGEVKWHQVPHRAGLNRCRKSCRLRWLNYLRPDIKRGSFAHDEVDLIIRLHKLLGNRWSLIAGRIPGRTANDVKNYWNTHLLKKSVALSTEVGKSESKNEITRTAAIKPRPRTFTALKLKSTVDHQCLGEKPIDPSPAPLPAVDDGVEWWDKLSFDDEMIIGDGIIWPDWG